MQLRKAGKRGQQLVSGFDLRGLIAGDDPNEAHFVAMHADDRGFTLVGLCVYDQDQPRNQHQRDKTEHPNTQAEVASRHQLRFLPSCFRADARRAGAHDACRQNAIRTASLYPSCAESCWRSISPPTRRPASTTRTAGAVLSTPIKAGGTAKPVQTESVMHEVHTLAMKGKGHEPNFGLSPRA